MMSFWELVEEPAEDRIRETSDSGHHWIMEIDRQFKAAWLWTTGWHYRPPPGKKEDADEKSLYHLLLLGLNVLDCAKGMGLAEPRTDLYVEGYLFLGMVDVELQEARKNFEGFATRSEGFGVLLEEILELRAEIFRKEQDPGAMLEELIQVAAMTQRLAEDCYGVPPAE